MRGASLLILLQVLSRAVTFVANQLLLRYLTAQLLGVSAQLEVYYLSVLFFARESLRVAIQRQGGSSVAPQAGADNAASSQPRREAQAVVNASYISILLGGLAAPILGWLYLSSAGTSASVSSTPLLSASLYVYGLAAVVELLSEPVFVVMQVRLRFASRARAEAVATLARCGVSLGSAVWAARLKVDLGVLPFALGQLGYGIALLGVYAWYGAGLAREEGFSLLPVKLDTSLAPLQEKTIRNGCGQYVLSYFYRPTLQLASSMMVQSFVKHILTQGDTFLVSIFSTPSAQGVYALANNYGGLIARLVFQPVEESSRSYFSRLLARPSKSEDRSHPLEKTAVLQANDDLQSLLKVYSVLSLIIVTLGPAAAPRLLSLIAGPHWISSGAGSCLSAYTWYIPLLAVNGVSEAFVASVATELQVHRQSAWMMFFSLAFACAGFVFMRVLDLGAVGLVWANGINMACRIIWCGIFISRYFGDLGVHFEILKAMPSPWGVLAGVVTSQAIATLVGTVAREATGPMQTVTSLVKIAAIAVPYVGALYVYPHLLCVCLVSNIAFVSTGRLPNANLFAKASKRCKHTEPSHDDNQRASSSPLFEGGSSIYIYIYRFWRRH